jgi:hypothetical protein
MIIFNNRKLIEAKFRNEQEIEDLVNVNSEHFFGPGSVLIPKAKINTKDGFGTIPDGFAIDLASRVWYIVEAELGHHSVWTHIAPQVSKQLLAAQRPETQQLLVEIIVQMVIKDQRVREKFEDEGINEIDVRKILGEILEQPPIIGMPIDTISQDLEDWARTLRNDVKLWIVKKYVEFGNPSVIAYDIPEEYRPVLDTTELDVNSKSGIRSYDVSIGDLITANLLTPGQEIFQKYKPRGGKRRTYRGIIIEDGSVEVLGEKFSSLSYAALKGINDAGSERTTVNGWKSWQTSDGKFLSDIRTQYLAMKEKEAKE